MFECGQFPFDEGEAAWTSSWHLLIATETNRAAEKQDARQHAWPEKARWAWLCCYPRTGCSGRRDKFSQLRPHKGRADSYSNWFVSSFDSRQKRISVFDEDNREEFHHLRTAYNCNADAEICCVRVSLDISLIAIGSNNGLVWVSSFDLRYTTLKRWSWRQFWITIKDI